MAKKISGVKEVKEDKQPTVVAEGVVRDAGKQDPIADNDLGDKERAPGAWKKVTKKELAELEAAGNLVGYDPATCEALVK